MPRVDPWIEQARRRAAHEADVRRRRRRMLVLVAGVVSTSAVAVAVALASFGGSDPTPSHSPGAVPPLATSTEPAATVAPTTIPPRRLLEVEEVWLIDRDDRIFDWGVVVRTPTAERTSRDVEVEVRLLDARDEVVETASVSLAAVGDRRPGVAAGRLTEPSSPPVRLEFDLVVGAADAETPLGDVLSLRALDRSGDRVSGRIRTTGTDEIGGFGVLFVWRDDVDDVVAAVPLDVERVRPGVDARFVLDLDTEPVPDGPPDDVFWVG